MVQDLEGFGWHKPAACRGTRSCLSRFCCWYDGAQAPLRKLRILPNSLRCARSVCAYYHDSIQYYRNVRTWPHAAQLAGTIGVHIQFTMMHVPWPNSRSHKSHTTSPSEIVITPCAIMTLLDGLLISLPCTLFTA